MVSYISFDDNAVVLIDKEKGEPRANRVFGPIPRELSEAGYQKNCVACTRSSLEIPKLEESLCCFAKNFFSP